MDPVHWLGTISSRRGSTTLQAELARLEATAARHRADFEGNGNAPSG
jgi:hypothetical protein